MNNDNSATIKNFLEFLDTNKAEIDPDLFAALMGFYNDTLDDPAKEEVLEKFIENVFGTNACNLEDMDVDSFNGLDEIDILDFYEQYMQ